MMLAEICSKLDEDSNPCEIEVETRTNANRRSPALLRHFIRRIFDL